MSQSNQALQPSLIAIMRGPNCEKCATQMKLRYIEPHRQLMNIDECHYMCECGATAIQLVPHT